MKKDLTSFTVHNGQYQTVSGINSFRDTIKNYPEQGLFKSMGFESAIDKLPGIQTHVDIGCGSGWLLFLTSKKFQKVVGIEPSEAACKNVHIIIEEHGVKNMEVINLDMIDAIKGMSFDGPILFTTGIVLSHIKNYYVKELLKLLDQDIVPLGSGIYFYERYDRNVQQRLWYIRRKRWWAKNLEEWQVEFFEIDSDGYKNGIFAKKVGRGNVSNTYIPTITENALWILDGIKQKILGAQRVASRLIRKVGQR